MPLLPQLPSVLLSPPAAFPVSCKCYQITPGHGTASNTDKAWKLSPLCPLRFDEMVTDVSSVFCFVVWPKGINAHLDGVKWGFINGGVCVWAWNIEKQYCTDSEEENEFFFSLMKCLRTNDGGSFLLVHPRSELSFSLHFPSCAHSHVHHVKHLLNLCSVTRTLRLLKNPE